MRNWPNECRRCQVVFLMGILIQVTPEINHKRDYNLILATLSGLRIAASSAINTSLSSYQVLRKDMVAVETYTVSI